MFETQKCSGEVAYNYCIQSVKNNKNSSLYIVDNQVVNYNGYTMTINENLITEIKKRDVISRDDLFALIKKFNKEVSKAYVYRIIASLIEDGYLFKVDSNTYLTDDKNIFSYHLNEKGIEDILKGYNGYFIWDTNIINKWANHLYNNVITFIEVDRNLVSFVYLELKKNGYKNVLVNPSIKEFDKYYADHMIIIKPTPKNLVENSCHISIERLVIELYSNKIINAIYPNTEIKNVINEIFNTYKINLRKLFHVAKRKKIYNDFHSFLLNCVDRSYIYHD